MPIYIFLAGACYTLEPLRSNGAVLSLADGIKGARLTEVVVEGIRPRVGKYYSKEMI